MDGPRDYHTKRSKSEKDIPCDITYIWNLKYDTNELIYETENRLWLPRGKGMWEGWIASLGLAGANYYI